MKKLSKSLLWHYIFTYALFVVGFITTSSIVFSADPLQSNSTNNTASSTSWTVPNISRWWNGGSSTADWLGLEPILEDYGLTVTGTAKEAYFGQVAGGLPNQSQSNWTTQLKLSFLYDFSKIFGLKGLTFISEWRYRNVGENPEYAAGTGYSSGSSASFMFNPSADTSGLGVRILPQYFEYTTPGKSVTINLGWENPYEQFLQQPLSKMFENNAITIAKGIGATAGPGIPVVNYTRNAAGQVTGANVGYYNTSPVPWSSTFASWGGTLKIRPTSQTYLQSGLYLAIANTGDVGATQFTPTSVYPYTSVPASYLGQFKNSMMVVPVVGGNGQLIPGATQNLGWVRNQGYNHGFNFQGAPNFNPSTANIGIKPSGYVTGTSTYKNAAGQTVTSPAYWAGSPYNVGNAGQYSQNGLYNVNELGWTPKLGTDKLEGKYVVGGYIWGQANNNYNAQFTQSVFPATYSVITGGTKSHPVYTTYPGNYTSPSYKSYDATKPGAFQQNQLIWGMYFQADQQLWRVPDADGKNLPSNSLPKSSKEKLSERGLYTFNEFTFTPPQNNALPLYFQSGLVFKGPLEARPKDSIGIAVGAGFYSSYYNSYISAQSRQLENAYGSAYNSVVPNGPTQQQPINPGTGTASTVPASSLKGSTYGTPTSTQAAYNNYYAYLPAYSSTEVVEIFYNIQINKWASLKPYAQFIANPAGNGTVGNDWILGASAKVTF